MGWMDALIEPLLQKNNKKISGRNFNAQSLFQTQWRIQLHQSCTKVWGRLSGEGHNDGSSKAKIPWLDKTYVSMSVRRKRNPVLQEFVVSFLKEYELSLLKIIIVDVWTYQARVRKSWRMQQRLIQRRNQTRLHFQKNLISWGRLPKEPKPRKDMSRLPKT